LKKSVTRVIKETLQREFILEKPSNLSFGHYATPIAFSLAKELKKSPIAIAEEICTKFDTNSIFQAVTPIKGYINFKLSEAFLDQYATWAIQHESEFGRDEYHESILLEYVSANPTGPLHIGHARGAVMGDALYRIGTHLGYKITSEYYVNDAGNQVDLLGLSLYLSGRENILGLEVAWPEEFYRGEYIIDLAHVAKSELGEAIFLSEENIKTLSIWGKDKMLELIRSNLADVGIEFEQFVSEKSLYDKWDESFKKIARESQNVRRRRKNLDSLNGAWR